MSKKVYTLDDKSLQKLYNDIEDAKDDLLEKANLFCREMARRGVDIAKKEVLSMGAIDSGELVGSIKLKKGDVIANGCSYYVYTDCEYAKFVEFGTGIVGEEYPHPQANDAGWKYDVNGHGDNGWWYMANDGKYHWTRGAPSRPFMHNTAVQLNSIVSGVAKEVFGK